MDDIDLSAVGVHTHVSFCVMVGAVARNTKQSVQKAPVYPSVISNYSATLATLYFAFQFQFHGLSLLLFSSTAEFWALAITICVFPKSLDSSGSCWDLLLQSSSVLWDGLELKPVGTNCCSLYETLVLFLMWYHVLGVSSEQLVSRYTAQMWLSKGRIQMEGSACGAFKYMCFG